MNKDAIIEQFKSVEDKYPTLTLVFEESNQVSLSGKLSFEAFCRNDKSTSLADSFEIKIVIDDHYPAIVPLLYETTEKIPQDFEHINPDGTCCLGVPGELSIKFIQNPTLLYFIEELVIPFLYSASWYNRYKVYPFGERPHGLNGIFDYYKEFWHVDNNRVACGLLFVALSTNRNLKYRGHQPCPCNSGIIGRQCHGTQFQNIFSVPNKASFVNDCMCMMDYFEKEIKNGKKYRASKTGF